MRNDLKKLNKEVETKKISYRCQVCGELFDNEVPVHLTNEDVPVKARCDVCEDDTGFRIIVTDPRILG